MMQNSGAFHIDFHEAFVKTVADVMRFGDDITVREMPTKELRGYSFNVGHGIRRFLAIPERSTNPFAQIAETLWMLAGSDKLDWLEMYIPQCKKWSDDGKTWRGAYGPRLRHWEQEEPWVPAVDQICNVVELLNRDPETRQAVMMIWDPGRDWCTSKDIPCNNWLQFIIRDNIIHLHVAVRSNDAIYGFSHNDFFSWSVLLEMMAFWVGAVPGSISWFAGSYHIYDKFYDAAESISNTNTPSIYATENIPMLHFDTEFNFFDSAIDDMMTAEKRVRKLVESGRWTAVTVQEVVGASKSFLDKFMYGCLQMMAAYILHKAGHADLTIDMINSMEDSDMKLSAIMFLIRDSKYSSDDFIHIISASPVKNFVHLFNHRF